MECELEGRAYLPSLPSCEPRVVEQRAWRKTVLPVTSRWRAKDHGDLRTEANDGFQKKPRIADPDGEHTGGKPGANLLTKCHFVGNEASSEVPAHLQQIAAAQASRNDRDGTLRI
jgi:hypothetical protein